MCGAVCNEKEAVAKEYLVIMPVFGHFKKLMMEEYVYFNSCKYRSAEGAHFSKSENLYYFRRVI